MRAGVNLTKTSDPDKYVYSGYCIGFDTHIEFSLSNGSVVKNVIIFGAEMSSSVHIDNKGKDILILGKGATQGLNNTALTAETQYSITFTRPNIKFCLSLYYDGSNSFLFVKVTSVQRKRHWNKKISLVFRKYFRSFLS